MGSPQMPQEGSSIQLLIGQPPSLSSPLAACSSIHSSIPADG